MPDVRRRRHRRHRDSATTATPTNGDGCSSTCQLEPGSTCPATRRAPRPGRAPRGLWQRREGGGRSLRLRHQPDDVPLGCTGPNGLFNGDGTGCSKTCTKEPICRERRGTEARRPARPAAGTATSRRARIATTATTSAATAARSTCKMEAGFTCSDQSRKDDAVDCMQSGNQRQAVPGAARSSTATSRTRASPAVTPTSSTWARPCPTPVSMDGRRRPDGRHRVQQALLRVQLRRPGQEERLGQPLLGPGHGEPRRARQARFNSARTGGTNLRLPVHRLEPRHQRRATSRATPGEQARPTACPRTSWAPAATPCTTVPPRS